MLHEISGKMTMNSKKYKINLDEKLNSNKKVKITIGNGGLHVILAGDFCISIIVSGF